MSDTPPKEKYRTNVAFLTWMACCFGICGVHRFYLGQMGMGLLYLFTFGLFGVGQLVNLIRMRSLVADENLKNEALLALAERRALGTGADDASPRALLPAQSAAELRVELTRAASRFNGRLSVAQAVLETGRDFEVVEAALDSMVKGGYVDIDNSETGTVVYVFGGLRG